MFYETLFPLAVKATAPVVGSLFLDSVLPLPILDSSPEYKSLSKSTAPISSADSSSTSACPTRSKRVVKKPGYLQDFHCGSVMDASVVGHSFTPYPLSNVISYNKLQGDFKAAMMSVSSISEPQSYAQAGGLHEWEQAMSDELKALEPNNTWTVLFLYLLVIMQLDASEFKS